MGRSDEPGLPEAPVGLWGPGGFRELADPLEGDRHKGRRLFWFFFG